jgi:hypothetical protein
VTRQPAPALRAPAHCEPPQNRGDPARRIRPMPLTVPADPPEQLRAGALPSVESHADHAPPLSYGKQIEARSAQWMPRDASTSSAGRKPSDPAWSEAERAPPSRFLPVVWPESRREAPARVEIESSSSAKEDPWPPLPEWTWQQWQTDPIQRQLREWDRRVRLTAEQAGSSWSGLPS